jgi:hypothetical protein
VAYLMVLSQDRIEKMRNNPQMSYQVRRYSRQYSNRLLLQYKSVELFIADYTEELNSVMIALGVFLTVRKYFRYVKSTL